MPVERILVVDDEETIREIVSSMLTHANYKCRQAASGLEAIALLDSGEEFELMLSDLMMADLDGIGLLERTKERFPDMPVVMVTAVHDISVALAAIRNGAYDYLLKPFEREQLLATVRRAMENRRLKLENRAYQTNLETVVAARTEQLRKAMVELERSYDITLEALGDALDIKDRETEGHSRRVTALTIAIARAMGLTADQIRVIARGAFLHDIGKMAILDAGEHLGRFTHGNQFAGLPLCSIRCRQNLGLIVCVLRETLRGVKAFQISRKAAFFILSTSNELASQPLN